MTLYVHLLRVRRCAEAPAKVCQDTSQGVGSRAQHTPGEVRHDVEGPVAAGAQVRGCAGQGGDVALGRQQRQVQRDALAHGARELAPALVQAVACGRVGLGSGFGFEVGFRLGLRLGSK